MQAKQFEMHSAKEWRNINILVHEMITKCVNNQENDEKNGNTSKRTKWMRKRRKLGRRNQKRSSLGCTRGLPFTISPPSRILVPILVMITCNFAPTKSMIWEWYQLMKLVFRHEMSWIGERIRWLCVFLLLTTRGMNGSQKCEYHPVHGKH